MPEIQDEYVSLLVRGVSRRVRERCIYGGESSFCPTPTLFPNLNPTFFWDFQSQMRCQDEIATIGMSWQISQSKS